MKILLLPIALGLGLGLAGCQTTTQATPDAVMGAKAPLAGTCTDPKENREKFYASVFLDNSLSQAAKIAKVREGILSRGGKPDFSSSFAAFTARVTGDTTILSESQEAANYYTCLTPFV